MQRGGFGNPFDVTTMTNGPLAIDMRDSVAAAFKNKGVRVTPIALKPGYSATEVMQTLRQTGSERSLLITVNEWKSDTFMNTALLYDVSARVIDAGGRTLGDSRIAGRDDLSGGLDSPGHAKAAVPVAFRARFEQLLNDPKVAAALK